MLNPDTIHAAERDGWQPLLDSPRVILQTIDGEDVEVYRNGSTFRFVGAGFEIEVPNEQRRLLLYALGYEL